MTDRERTADLARAMRDNRLTENQRMAIPLLAAGMSREQVAERLGVSEYTVRDWMQPRHVVRQAVELSILGSIAAVQAKIAAHADTLTNELLLIATDSNYPAKDRIAAIRECFRVMGLGQQGPAVTVQINGTEQPDVIFCETDKERLRELTRKTNR